LNTSTAILWQYILTKMAMTWWACSMYRQHRSTEERHETCPRQHGAELVLISSHYSEWCLQVPYRWNFSFNISECDWPWIAELQWWEETIIPYSYTLLMEVNRIIILKEGNLAKSVKITNPFIFCLSNITSKNLSDYPHTYKSIDLTRLIHWSSICNINNTGTR
jgi:hypothetical protein